MGRVQNFRAALGSEQIINDSRIVSRSYQTVAFLSKTRRVGWITKRPHVPDGTARIRPERQADHVMASCSAPRARCCASRAAMGGSRAQRITSSAQCRRARPPPLAPHESDALPTQRGSCHPADFA
ncbi:hypothetical protein VTN96DRAFT_4239 [Rasamsonia emersonii]